MHQGQLFRQIRIRKNFKLKQTAQDIVSTQFLLKFERGESDISMGNLLLLLGRINVAIEDFMTEFYQLTEIRTLAELEASFDEVLITSDAQKWQRLYDECSSGQPIVSGTNAAYSEYLKIILKNIGKLLFDYPFEIDNQPIVNYLESVETWGKYEFFLATYCANDFDTQTLKHLWRQAFSKRIQSVTLQRFSVDFYLHVCLNLIKQGEIELTKAFLTDYERWQEPQKILQNLSYTIMSQYLWSLIGILEGQATGKHQCEELLDFFYRQIGYHDYAKQLARTTKKLTQVELELIQTTE